MIRYGFACKTVGVPGADQTTLTLARADEQNLLRVSRHNLHALGVMLRYCRDEGIRLMRISSDIIPLASHPDVTFEWKVLLQEELAAVKALIADAGVRVSMHPGQYTILNSPHDEVVERAVDDLRFHADFLDAVDADRTARIILHLGGGYGDKPAALKRLARNLETLPDHIRNRLALENDERIYPIEDVLKVCDAFSLPAVFDVYHHSINPPPLGTMHEWLDKAGLTWKGGHGRQKIHYSQQWPGGKPGMHLQSIGMDEFLKFHAALGERELDVMLEVKDKNLSAVKCANLTSPDLPRQRLTEEWARYKYLILEHDPTTYGEIRTLLKREKPDGANFYGGLERALEKDVTSGHARNKDEIDRAYKDVLQKFETENKRVIAQARESLFSSFTKEVAEKVDITPQYVEDKSAQINNALWALTKFFFEGRRGFRLDDESRTLNCTSVITPKIFTGSRLGRNEYGMAKDYQPRSGRHTITGSLAKNIIREICWRGIPEQGAITVDGQIEPCTIALYQVRIKPKNSYWGGYYFYPFAGRTISGRELDDETCRAIMTLPVTDFTVRGEPVGDGNRHLRGARPDELDELIRPEEFIQKVLTETGSAEREEIERMKASTANAKTELERGLDGLRTQIRAEEHRLDADISRLEKLEAQKKLTALRRELKQGEQNLFMDSLKLDMLLEEQIREFLEKARLTADVTRQFVVHVRGK